MLQTPSDRVEVWRQAAQKRLFLLLGYSLSARRTRAEMGTELGEELSSHMNEARLKTGYDSEDNVLCAWRMKDIKDIA